MLEVWLEPTTLDPLMARADGLIGHVVGNKTHRVLRLTGLAPKQRKHKLKQLD
jgi:translation initiation factor 2 gamma subunit (eIF-2gamma)